MKTLFGQVVFVADSRQYDWEDVVLAAKLWGDWTRLEQDVRRGIACLKRMQDTGEGPTREEVQAEAAAFRYARNLISAEEAEVSLKQRHLTVEAWLSYIRRSLLRQRWAAQLADILSQYPVTDAEVARCVVSEGVCSGHFAGFAQKLAARAAIYEKVGEASASGASARCSAPDLNMAFQALPPATNGRQLWQLSPERYQAKIKVLACLEIVFQRFCRQALTSKAIQGQISARHLDWIRLDCRYVSFSAEQMAYEAALCVREEGMELAAVAARAKTALYRGRFYLDQLEPALQSHFLGAHKGELLGPFHVSGEFVLFWMLDKVTPTSDDPDIRERAKQCVLQRLIDDAIDRRVQWYGSWCGAGHGRAAHRPARHAPGTSRAL